MAKIRVSAARVRQGTLVLFTTALRVQDLMTGGFYSVERLDPSNEKGYQRLLNTARAKRLADYIVKGQESEDAFLQPRSISLPISR